jgi:hypothetical protein
MFKYERASIPSVAIARWQMLLDHQEDAWRKKNDEVSHTTPHHTTAEHDTAQYRTAPIMSWYDKCTTDLLLVPWLEASRILSPSLSLAGHSPEVPEVHGEVWCGVINVKL